MFAVPSLISPTLQSIEGVSHGFFTRKGGVSKELYSSLNCGQLSGDDASDVKENRNRVCVRLGCSSLVSLKQVHGRQSTLVTSSNPKTTAVEGDGMVTVEPGIALGIMGADCAGILFADTEAGVVGAAHGGWKGALLGITDSVIELMC
ncbi:MAG: polyphenol oxidase family protein, partial [bacterium]